jgi:pyruvate-formate lyase-activating enzyme
MGQTGWRTLPLEQRKTLPIGPQDEPPYFNRKQIDPSELMHAPDGRRYRCSWVENGLTLQSDGNVTCGLDDPYSRRSFGNACRQSLAEIWANPEYVRLQEKMWQGHRCIECNLAQPLDDDSQTSIPARPERPTTLVVETTVRCNLRCPQQACIPNNDRKVKTRDADFLDLDAFKRVADSLAGNLSHVFFFNYGDPFVHHEADQMLAHLYQTSPDAHVRTSTNGIPLSKLDRARDVVAARALGFMMFTISGVTQKSYSRYHVGGRLDLALQGMANVIEAKKEFGLANPVVHWRYLVFNWNDSEAEIDEAIRLSQQYGVDEFSLHLTHVPLDAMSSRFSPGSPSFSRYRQYIDNALGYTKHMPAPDENGFYRLEHSNLGLARWTSWQARKLVSVKRNKAKISVSSHRPSLKGSPHHVFLLTEWQKIKVAIEPGVWKKVQLDVPRGVDLDQLEVQIVTFDHWFPAEDGVDDQRCLGVLIRESDEKFKSAYKWPNFKEITVDESDRLLDFKYKAPRPLVDW